MTEPNQGDDQDNEISSIDSDLSSEEEDAVVDDADDANSSTIDADDDGSCEQCCEPSSESVAAKDISSKAHDGRKDVNNAKAICLRSADASDEVKDTKDATLEHEDARTDGDAEDENNEPKNIVSKKKHVRAARTKKREDSRVVVESLVCEKLENSNKIASEAEDDTALKARSSSDSGKQTQLPPVPPKYKTPKRSGGTNQHSKNYSEVKRHTAPSAVKPTPQMNSNTKRRSSEMTMTAQKSSLFPRDDEDLVSKFLAFKEATYASKIKANTDLLSNFVTYQDTPSARPRVPQTDVKEPKTRPATALKAVKQRPLTEPKARRPSTSPLLKFGSAREDKRKPGLEKRKSVAGVKLSDTKVQEPRLPNPHKSYDADDYDIPANSLTQRRNSLSPRTIESHQTTVNTQSQEAGPDKPRSMSCVKTEKPVSKPVFNNLRSWSNAQRMMLSTLSMAVKFFSFLCIAARCMTFFGGKRSLFYYIAEAPAVWIIRLYVLLFHAILIMVEMKICVPGILPRETLDNFLHRAFIQSFIGLLDMSMNSNKALVEHVSDTASDSDMEIWIDISYAVLSVAPKGLIACSIFYFMFAVCGFSGNTAFIIGRRPAFNGAPAEFTA